ncbi:MAG: DUF2125 domain-containing protein [Pseudorhodoplanes sp.]
MSALRPDPAFHPALQPRRGRWGLIVPVLAVLALAIGWSAFWYYSASIAERTIDQWLAREARLGRLYACDQRQVGGYPFRIEVRCGSVTAELRNVQPALQLAAGEVLVASQIYQPTLLIGEFTGPFNFIVQGQPTSLVGNWTLAQASVRGRPDAPDRISVVIDNPALDQTTDGVSEALVRGSHAEAHGRIAEGSASDKPVLDAVFQLRAVTAPRFHPLLAQPTDADVDLTLRGLSNLAPKPWPQPLRELQAANGRIEVKRLRLQQGDAIAVAVGSIGLTAAGRPDGELQITAVNLDKFLVALGVDNLVPRGSPSGDRINSALGALDRILPGLGQVARDRAGLGLAAGVLLLGEQAELEGKRAVRVPLRFIDGVVSLGPIPLGNIAPLF